MTTPNKDIYHQLSNAELRMLQILHIGGMSADTYCCPEWLHDLLYDLRPEDLKKLFPEWETEDTFDDEGDVDGEIIHDLLVCQEQKLGFLIEFGTPYPQKLSDGSRHSTWSIQRTQWFYGETLEDCISQALPWAKKIQDEVPQDAL